MKALLHKIFCYFGAIFWIISVTTMTITTLFASLCDWVDPTSKMGNCWSFALPKWAKQGGYLLIRPADGNRFLKIFPVPHVLWVKQIPKEGLVLEQFFPLERKQASWFPHHTLYYKGIVKTKEHPHNI